MESDSPTKLENQKNPSAQNNFRIDVDNMNVLTQDQQNRTISQNQEGQETINPNSHTGRGQ